MCRKAVVYLGFMISVFLCSCSTFFKSVGNYNSYVESFEFRNGKSYVEVDDISVIYVTASPSDSFDYLTLEFELADEEVACITDVGKSYCMVKGLKKGSTIITAHLGNSECKGVITVR